VRGLRIPEDVAIVGYDDIEEGRYSNPTLTTISPDKATIASTAVDRLLKRISSDHVLTGIEIKTSHQLIARESTLGRNGTETA
jgi:LacI family transcriptional regulator, repressor for deo operon, udp, cdd, tsx, nupC, and nupG